MVRDLESGKSRGLSNVLVLLALDIQGLRTILDPFMLKTACAYKKS